MKEKLEEWESCIKIEVGLRSKIARADIPINELCILDHCRKEAILIAIVKEQDKFMENLDYGLCHDCAFENSNEHDESCPACIDDTEILLSVRAVREKCKGMLNA